MNDARRQQIDELLAMAIGMAATLQNYAIDKAESIGSDEEKALDAMPNRGLRQSSQNLSNAIASESLSDASLALKAANGSLLDAIRHLEDAKAKRTP